MNVIYLKITKKHRWPHEMPSRAACLTPLLSSKNLVCSATSRRKTAVGIIHLCFNYFAACL